MFIVNFITQTLCTIYLCFHIYETSCKHVKVVFLINYKINYYGNYFIISICSTITIKISSYSANNTNIWHLCWNNSFLVIWLGPPEKFWLDLLSSWYIYKYRILKRNEIRAISYHCSLVLLIWYGYFPRHFAIICSQIPNEESEDFNNYEEV